MWRFRGLPSRRTQYGLMCLDDTLEALGRDGVQGREAAEVPVHRIVGTASRSSDFDGEFRLLNECLAGRWQQLADATVSGAEPPPVELVRLGDLYFVQDGHHRVSVARSLGRDEINARVLVMCSTAYALCCLRMAHLPSKAAERRFLERVPLPRDVRSRLWLDDPAEWTRLADAAEAWALRQALSGKWVADRGELALRWWNEEVVPVLEWLRAAGAGLDLRDVRLYATALALRDRLGYGHWPADLVDYL